MAASLATAFFPRAKVCPLTSFFNLTVFRCQVLPPGKTLRGLKGWGKGCVPLMRRQVCRQVRRAEG